MFGKEKYENILFFVILPRDFSVIGIYKPQIVIKIPLVLVLRVNLSIILPFSINCLYFQVDLQMFSEDIYENILFVLILLPDLLFTGTHRPQIVSRHPWY